MSDEQREKKGGGGDRCTIEEQDERIRLVADLLALGYFKAQIKQTVISRYGVTARTAERYLSRAREMLREYTEEDIEDHRGKALKVYWGVVRDPAATPMEKVRAQQRIDKILGLESAHKVEHSGNLSLGDMLEQADADADSETE